MLITNRDENHTNRALRQIPGSLKSDDFITINIFIVNINYNKTLLIKNCIKEINLPVNRQTGTLSGLAVRELLL
jgi:thioredoxin-related protein